MIKKIRINNWFKKKLRLKIFFWLVIILFSIYCYQNRFYLYEIGKHYYHQIFSSSKQKFEKNHHVIGLGVKLPKFYSVYGVDVSRHQGIIDWDALSNQTFSKFEFSFVFMKATEGSRWKDGMFQRNWENAKNTDLICGAYHFYKPGINVKAQIQNFIDEVKLESGDFPPVLDIEKFNPKLSVKDHQKEILQILTEFEKVYKTKPIIYTNLDIFETLLNDKKFKNFPLWIAKYHVDEPAIDSQWKFWQFSELGVVKGVDEFVDINVFRGSLRELRKLQIP